MDNATHSFDAEDPGMGAAIAQARSSLKDFFDRFTSPRPNQDYFLLKVAFEEGAEVEHIWVGEIDGSVFPLAGTIGNAPRLPSLKFMQRVRFHPSRITDWMYIEDGYLVGGFTILAAREAMTPLERADYDASVPYKFRRAL